MKKIFYLLLIILIPFNVYAKKENIKESNDFSISCDKVDNINFNEQIICRFSTNTDFVYNQINFEVQENAGFEIIDIRSNYDKIWKVVTTGNKISATSTELQEGLQEFGIILIKAVNSGVYDFNLSNINLVNTFSDDTKALESVSVSLKVISTDNLLKGIYINDELLDGFDANKVSYEYFIDDDVNIKIAAESSNEFADIEGIGEFEMLETVECEVFPIKVISEDGASKIYLLNIHRNNFVKDNIDKSLESIIIKNDKGNNLLINFSPETFEYNFDVDINTSYLEIKPLLNDNNLSFVKGYGEQKIELKSGANIAIIKVKDDEGQVLNYVLNIIKPIANRSSNNYIKNLLIKGHKLSFSKKVKNYSVEIGSNEKSLEIIPTLESETASYTISGNNNLKDGSIIKITVTAENEEKQVYKINVKVKKTNYTVYVLLILSLGIIVYLIEKYRKKLTQNRKAVINKNNYTAVKVNVKPAPSKNKNMANKNASSKNTANKNTTNKNAVFKNTGYSKTKTSGKGSTNKNSMSTNSAKNTNSKNVSKNPKSQMKNSNVKNNVKKSVTSAKSGAKKNNSTKTQPKKSNSKSNSQNNKKE